tara:strand:- start:112983 stop:113177 length:195 start_codon:yes stop_codon:yes gene_type:complete
MKKALLTLTIVLFSSCSSRGIYEGLQASNRFECGKQPFSLYQACMERAGQSYDDYRRARDEMAL